MKGRDALPSWKVSRMILHLRDDPPFSLSHLLIASNLFLFLFYR